MAELASGAAAPGGDRVRAAELVGVLFLATDLSIGVPLEHGVQSTLVAMRLAGRLGVDPGTASQTYYACLLFYVGCTATAGVAADIFGEDDALTTYATPVRFGSQPQMIMGMMRAVAPPGGAPLERALQVARAMPKLAREFEPSDAEERIEAWCATLPTTADGNSDWIRADIEDHVRDEHSTYAWLLEPMIERSGFRIERTEYSPDGFFAEYIARAM